MSFDSIDTLIQAIANGEMVIMMDDENRENEGDLIMAASLVQAHHVNFMINEARGLLCLAMSPRHCQRLELEPITRHKASPLQANFMVPIDAARGIHSGISAADRAYTIHLASQAHAQPHQFTQPGHIFPLGAHPEGVLARAGHTETAVDLARLAGLTPVATLIEILNKDGTMARQPDLMDFAHRHRLKIGTVADLITYRQQKHVCDAGF